MPAESASECGIDSRVISSYECKPLDEGQIRLLRIDWSVDNSLQHVFPWTSHCKTLKLETFRVKLDEERVYNALSYVWGTEPVSVAVSCNGMPLLITPTVYEMLAHLDHGAAYWIDAVCIDQNDPNEKATQIPLMNQIYSRAECVLIWLGCSDPYLQAFMADFDRVDDLSRAWKPKDETGQPDWRGEDWPIDGADFWYGFDRLLRHPWFERLWTFQEATLAKSGSAYLLYDTKRIHILDFFAFLIGALHLPRSYFRFPWTDFDPVTGVKLGDMYALQACRLLWWRLEGERRAGRDPTFSPEDLPAMFNHLVGRKAKEEVDKVWAVVGVLPQPLQDYLRPLVDYSQQARREYWKTWLSFTKAVFEVGQSLALLNIPPPDSSTNLPVPTWAPDLSLSHYMCRLHINLWWHKPFSAEVAK